MRIRFSSSVLSNGPRRTRNRTPLSASVPCWTDACQPASASRAFRFSASASLANEPACSQKRSGSLAAATGSAAAVLSGAFVAALSGAFVAALSPAFSAALSWARSFAWSTTVR